MTKEITNGCVVNDSTVKRIMKSEIVESIVREMEAKEAAKLKRDQKASKKLKIDKLVDAQSKDRLNCTIAIYEGLSAQNGSLEYRNPQTQGLFMLKGKFHNTRKLSDKQIISKPDIVELMNSIGLTLNEEPTEKDLRFGEIHLVMDQDIDGDSITAQMINFLSKWKSLFEQKRVYKVLTPLLVIKKGKDKKYFYTNDDWLEFQKNNSIKGYTIDYKKGLGSLEDDEYKEMVEKPRKVLIEWDESSENLLDVWFSDKDECKKERKNILL